MNHGMRLLSSLHLKMLTKDNFGKKFSAEWCLKKLSAFPICSTDSALDLFDGLNSTNIISLLDQTDAFRNSQTSNSSKSAKNSYKLR